MMNPAAIPNGIVDASGATSHTVADRQQLKRIATFITNVSGLSTATTTGTGAYCGDVAPVR